MTSNIHLIGNNDIDNNKSNKIDNHNFKDGNNIEKYDDDFVVSKSDVHLSDSLISRTVAAAVTVIIVDDKKKKENHMREALLASRLKKKLLAK